MVTKFTVEKLAVPMPDGKEFTFWFDGNGKITMCDGTYENPVANSFSLVQVEDCPFATPTCKSTCYVHGLEKAVEEIHNKYRSNSRVIREVLVDPSYQKTSVQAFANWIHSRSLSTFRWHVAGDILSLRHARFIRGVCDLVPNVLFIIYTRSFKYLKPLVGSKNLIVNLSADKDNWDEAWRAHKKYNLRLCYLTIEGEVPSELLAGSVIFPAYKVRGRDLPNPTDAPWWQSLNKYQRRMVCPTDFFGQSESIRCGPCKKCFVPFK